MTAPAFVAAGLGPTSSTTTAVIPKPAGTASGHVLYALLVNGGAGTAPTTVPSGWALTSGAATGGGGWVGVYEHVAGGSEPTSYTWDGFTDSCAGSMIAVSGADTTTPTHQVHATATLNSAGPSDAGVTTTVADCLIVGGCGVGDNVGVSTWACATDPTVLTERAEVQSTGGADTTSALATAPQTAVGPTGALSVVLAGSRNSMVFTIAVQPPQTGGGGVSGTLAATLPYLTGAVVLGQQDAGSLTATLPHLAASVASSGTQSGTLTASLPHLAAASSIALKDAGTAAATLPHLAASAAVSQTDSGALAASLPRLGAATAASETDPASLAATLPRLAAAFGTGTPPDTAALAATLPALAAGAAVAQTDQATATAALPHLSAQAAAGLTDGATAALTLPSLVVDLRSSTPATDGTLAATLPALVISLGEEETISGHVAASLPTLRASIGSAASETAVLAAALPSLRAAVSDAPLVVDELPDLAASIATTGRLAAAVTVPGHLTASVAHAGRLAATVQ